MKDNGMGGKGKKDRKEWNGREWKERELKEKII